MSERCDNATLERRITHAFWDARFKDCENIPVGLGCWSPTGPHYFELIRGVCYYCGAKLTDVAKKFNISTNPTP